MTNYLYPAGMDLWDSNWPTLDLHWMLIGAMGGFSPHADTIADLAPDEVAVAGYARQPLTGAMRFARETDTNQQSWDFAAQSPSFTGLAAGEQIGGLVLYAAGADDATSTPLTWWSFLPYLDTGAGDFDFSFPPVAPWHPSAPPGTCVVNVYWVQGGG